MMTKIANNNDTQEQENNNVGSTSSPSIFNNDMQKNDDIGPSIPSAAIPSTRTTIDECK